MTTRLKRLILFAVSSVPLTPVRVAKRWEWQKDKGKTSSWQKSGSVRWPRK
jgi:hypothetical protein